VKYIIAYAVVASTIFGLWGLHVYNKTQELKASAYRLGVWYGQNCK
jgi:hypothetical protein